GARAQRALERVGQQILGQRAVSRAVGEEREQPRGLGVVEPLEVRVAHLTGDSIRKRAAPSYQWTMNHPDDLHPDDLQSVVDQLRAHRPEATALELDAVKQRVRSRVARRPAGRRARSASLMKSRLAILSMLVTGILLST